MPNVGSLALAVTWALWGPPKLPPLPGERPPEPPAEEAAPAKPSRPAPAQPKPKPRGPAAQKPTARPVAPKPAAPPQKPAPPPQPTVEPTPEPLPPPGPAPPPVESEFDAGVAEPPADDSPPGPPQPEPRGPAPEEGDAPSGTEGERSKGGKRSARGAGQAPAMGDDGLLPGDVDDERPAMPLFPPPTRPPYRGTGLMVGAGVAFGASLAEQIVAHVLVKRRCIDPLGETMQIDPTDMEQTEDQADDYTQVLLRCAPGVLPAVALRIYSDAGLLAMIGLASGGAAMRARQVAFDDVFADRPARPVNGLRIAGASLLGVGLVTWLTTGAVSWGLLASCRDAKCASRARLMAFTTRDTGAVLVASGAGMLSYSLAYRRAHDRTLRDRMLSVGTALMPGGGAGVTVSGRF